MLQSVQNLFGYTISARDGNVGKARDFLFDDRSWKTRYLVVDTGKWLPGRKVLIPPECVGQPVYQGSMFPVDLPSEVIESGPSIGADMPVSKQHESEFAKHYATAGFGAGVPAIYEEADEVSEGDAHLRSADEVIKYRISASDDEIGRVDDFIAEDEDWTLRYMVIDTNRWLPGRKVLIATEWVDWVDWSLHHVGVNLTRDQIENSPEFDPSLPINREYEERLYDYYGRPVYWLDTRV